MYDKLEELREKIRKDLGCLLYTSNSKDNQTNLATNKPPTVFERYINSKDNQTSCCVSFDNARLRDRCV